MYLAMQLRVCLNFAQVNFLRIVFEDVFLIL